MRMSPTVPRPPPLSVDVVIVGWGWTCVEVSGAAGGSGWNGLCWARARAGAASARSASSSAVRATTDGNLANAALHAERVAHREAFPVVVEVGEDVALGRELAQPRRPLVELAVGVVAAPAPGAPVEADEGEVARGRRLGERAARVERDDGRHAVAVEQLVDGVGEP